MAHGTFWCELTCVAHYVLGGGKGFNVRYRIVSDHGSPLSDISHFPKDLLLRDGTPASSHLQPKPQ